MARGEQAFDDLDAARLLPLNGALLKTVSLN